MAQARRKTQDDDSGKAISAGELTRAARQIVEDLTSYTPEAVSGFQWDGEAWLVTVDVCEMRRIPNTTDVMATYVVQLDESGGLLGYKRERRFQRGHAEEA